MAYVTRLATALTKLTTAQNSWVAEIEALSLRPALMHDPTWRARSSSALDAMVAAADGLRIEPVPETFGKVDAMLARAQREARLAFDGYGQAVKGSSAESMLVAIRHVDRMSENIQKAAALIRR